MCHWAVCIWQDWYCPSGCGSEWDRDVKGELLILSEYSPGIYSPADLCFLFRPSTFFFFYTLLFLVPHWESLPKCVSWVLADAFYDSEECKCVEIFKRSSELHHCHSALAASKNKYGDCWNVPLLWIHHWSGRASQHCVNGPRPTQSPIGFRVFIQWKCTCKPFVSSVYRQRVFHKSVLERSIIGAALPMSHPTEKSPWSWSPSWYMRIK